MEAMDNQEYDCGICKVTYTTDVELEDHNWSLMHHIKIEKIKKGAPHSCNLCMESCANIIEYGKHLNEDRHKHALTRRAKEGTELLDSFATQSGLLGKDISPEMDNPLRNHDFVGHISPEFTNFTKGHKFHGFRGQGPPVSKHSRSFSQPDLHSARPPSLVDINPDSMKSVEGGNIDKWLKWVNIGRGFANQPQQQPGHGRPGQFKVPQGRPGHFRTHNDMRYNYNNPECDIRINNNNVDPQQYHTDNFHGINWNDNRFYSDEHSGNNFRNNPYQWHRDDRNDRNKTERNEPGRPERCEGGRRGSFDSNIYRNNRHSRNEGMQDELGSDDRHERGRRIFRTNKGAGRARSFDNNSPESTSSSDSGLKRRLENDDSFAPGKSRRRYGPEMQFSAPRSTYISDSSHSLMDDQSNQRPRSRSSSRDRVRDTDRQKSDTDRPSSRSSDKRVSWCDQQLVSSTTDSTAQPSRNKINKKSCKGQRNARAKSRLLPDSSSESELSKTQNISERSSKTQNISERSSKTQNISERSKAKNSGTLKGKTSPQTQRKSQLPNDTTETVLEKAENLCKKLRNEREKAKQKKNVEEKKKKSEKQKEINDMIETLSEQNKSNITGVLDSENSSYIANMDMSDDFYKLDGTTGFSDISVAPTYKPKSAGIHIVDELNKPQLIPERLTSTLVYQLKSSSKMSQESVTSGSNSKNITQRIAQTKADIDSIREKIESSVKTNFNTGSVSLTEPDVSPPKQIQTDSCSSHGRYLQTSDRTSLRKMVNSPRTTKECNQLAQMLREHAKSQNKLSLPRFNLKFSDLCENSDRQDEQVNIDTLAPSVQLQIANIIEADVKPNIAELEKLLDQASAGNAELDMNILSNLGLTTASPVRRAGSPVVTPTSIRLNIGSEGHVDDKIQPLERSRSPISLMSPERQNVYEYEAMNRPLSHERSRSPISLMPPERPNVYEYEAMNRPLSHERSRSPISLMPPERPNVHEYEAMNQPLSHERSRSPISLMPPERPNVHEYEAMNRPLSHERSRSPISLMPPERQNVHEYEAMNRPQQQQISPERSKSPIASVPAERLRNEYDGTSQHQQRQISHERSRSPVSSLLPERRGMSRLQQPKIGPDTNRTSALPIHSSELNAPETLQHSKESVMMGEAASGKSLDQSRHSSAQRDTTSLRDNVNTGQTLNIGDLRIEITEGNRQRRIIKQEITDSDIRSGDINRFASSVPVSSTVVSSAANLSASISVPSSGVRIKQEKPDDGYEQAVSSALSKAKAFFNRPSQLDSRASRSVADTPDEIMATRYGDLSNENAESANDDVNSGRFSPVRKSFHRQNLYSNDELPVRDFERAKPHSSETDARSTLEKVTSILDGVPAPSVESGVDKSSSTTPVEAVPEFNLPKEKYLDSSQNSQASVLEEVYSVSVHEESVRQEISTMDLKISKLKSLIDEASQELNRCSQEKQSLVDQERSFRMKRLKLLEDSRSSSACSQTIPNADFMGNLTREQLDNPLLIKFLMSQRQSDISSLGGYSNVETGSQPDSEINQQRRGSLTSNISDPLSMPAENLPNTESELFSRSVDVLSGSSETLISVLLKANTDTKPDGQKPSENEDLDSINSTNSISMLHKPLDKVGFVTLDALMRGDGDIGRLLNRSIESIEKGVIPAGASPLQKQSSNDSQSRGSSSVGQRERRDSTFSLDTGSDSEKKSVSMKYMGTLPEGTNYESFVKQVSQENKNKSLMFTVFSSPEAVSQRRRTPDAGSTPVLKPSEGCMGVEPGYKSDGSSQTNSTRTLTHMSDMESQSVISMYSLGEQIKRLCDEHNTDETMDIETPRTAPDDTAGATGTSDVRDSVVKFDGVLLSDVRSSPVRDCYIKLEQLDTHINRSSPKTVTLDNCSPIRKRLKSKKERDQKSRRKQKESFILLSDTNSSGENESKSVNKVMCLPSQLSSKCEEDLVQTGSEERTPRPSETQEAKRSLLDEVQLETETPSDSCEDRSQSAGQKQRSIHYKGPSLSVASIQEFKGDLYVCYNGSEIRRFELKTGRILKELDCSPYLVNCLHVTSIVERGDILYTGGTCKKLMLFEPQKFNLITTYEYTERITCLHENWGRLFVGLSDGRISVRSLKADKELNCFSCTMSTVHSLGSASAGMTKMLCLATGDKILYILDAITGLLITMLEGHTQPPRCLQLSGEKVFSGGTDQTLMIHSIPNGELLKMAIGSQIITHIWCNDSTIYTAGNDSMVRTYNYDLKPGEMLQGTGGSIVTCGVVHDKMVIIGKRDGSVEALLQDDLSNLTCREHILTHLKYRQ